MPLFNGITSSYDKFIEDEENKENLHKVVIFVTKQSDVQIL